MKERSAAIDYVKGLSIISVICAHCNSVAGSASAFANVSSLILQNLGTFGVICFMVISGMLFRPPQNNVVSFFGKKLKGIVIPWIISATCVWLYVYLRQPPLTVESWIQFAIGDGSYLYYLTMLMLFYVVFTFLPFMRNIVALVLCVLVTAISCVWFYELGGLSPYLNPLNWIGFFALGMCITKHNNKLVHRGGTFAIAMCASWILCVGLLAMQVFSKDGGWYFGGMRAITSWTGAAALASLGIWLARCKENKVLGLLRCAGENTFFIYIWHMPIAGIVAKLASIGPLQYAVLIRPLVVLAVVMVAYKVAEIVLDKMKISKIGFVIGINRR